MTVFFSGTHLTWQEIKQVAEQIRRTGILQLIHQWPLIKDVTSKELLWGDEIEYLLVHFDDEKRQTRLTCKAVDILRVVGEAALTEDKPQDEKIMDKKQLELEKKVKKDHDKSIGWHPECMAFTIEGTNTKPYSGELTSILEQRAHLQSRRRDILELLTENEALITLAGFPTTGCANCLFPEAAPAPRTSLYRSIFLADAATFDGCQKMVAETRNITDRRGKHLACNVPIYVDTNTPVPFVEDLSKFAGTKEAQEILKRDAISNHIFMDTLGFGSGCCALQVTMQAPNLENARWLYDQLAVVTPIALALTAAVPFYRGYISDIDSRWNVFADLIDDRTEEERGLKPLDESKYKIERTRYCSIECYLGKGAHKYNNVGVVHDRKYCQQLMASGIDEEMALYVAHLFIRDPVQALKETVEQSTEDCFAHFLNIQGTTNWPTVRLKFPLDEKAKQFAGWRVEFRVMENSLTDFENGAFSTFIYLLGRAILKYKLEMRIPISKLESNMNEASRRDACRRCVFHFRMLDKIESTDTLEERLRNPHEKVLDDYYVRMSVDEIINGSKQKSSIGLVNIVRRYLTEEEAAGGFNSEQGREAHELIKRYLELISLKAAGKLDTTAMWQRKFVANHPAYKKDSRITPEIAYDLVKTATAVSKGERVEKSLCPFQL